MKFRTFKQNKLWKDKAIDLLETQNSKVYWVTLDEKEFQKQLRLKLIEEAQEILHAGTKEELLEKLTDILEIINALKDASGINLKELTTLQKKKFEKYGGFENKKFVTFIEHPKDSFEEKYCLANPDKYPEIKN